MSRPKRGLFVLCVYYAMHKVVQRDHAPVIAEIFIKMPCILFPYYCIHNGLENGKKKPQKPEITVPFSFSSQLLSDKLGVSWIYYMAKKIFKNVRGREN